MTVKIVTPRRIRDDRGWFRETYAEARYAALGMDVRFVQDNQSCSVPVGTIRGFHLQVPPLGQAKLVQCDRGRIIDYVLDLRRGSPTYGKTTFAELSAANGRQLFIPEGFGHAFVTLEPDTEVAYKVSSPYSPAHERGIAWDCPDIAIDWPLPPSGPVLSDKDRALPRLADFDSPFDYDGTPMPDLGVAGDPADLD